MDRRTLGCWGEEVAARALQAEGWTVLGRNVRVGRDELDLIAQREGTTIFVEVKTRSERSLGAPVEALSFAQRRRIARAAAAWLREKKTPTRVVRFDLIAVAFRTAGPPQVEHVEDAWWRGG